MRNIRTLASVLAASAILALTISGAATATPANIAPKFEDAPCPMKIPDGQHAENVRCGFLSVPETRGSADGRIIKIAVAILKSTSARPKRDPVVYLTGGPGFPALDGELQGLGQADTAAFIQSERDFIFFDQRGTGHYQDGLFCPETDHLVLDSLVLDRSPAEARAARRTALVACHDRFVAQGVNVNAYSSVATAHDIADMMRVLGYDDYNLYGTSYGPRAILAAMRETPNKIRSVILDSPLAPQANSGPDRAPDLQRSLRELFDSCAADTKCHAAYPRLEEEAWDLIHRANAHPIEVQINDADGKPITIRISGRTLLAGTFGAFYNISLIRVLPFAIDQIANGNYGILAILAQQLAFQFTGSAEAMGTSVDCNEEIPFYTSEQIQAASKGVRPEIIDAEVGISSQGALDDELALCKAWGTPAPRSRENEAVVSAIPALVLDGQFDPITPPSYGKLAAEHLSRSFVYLFRSSGHGVTYEQYDCATNIIQQFLAAPPNRPNSACLTTIQPLDFVIGDDQTTRPSEAGSSPAAAQPSVPQQIIKGPDTGTGASAAPQHKINIAALLALTAAAALLAACGVTTARRSAHHDR